MDQKIPPVEEAKDTKYVKHIKIQSKLLSEWWGSTNVSWSKHSFAGRLEEHPLQNIR